MNIQKIIAELREERVCIDEVLIGPGGPGRLSERLEGAGHQHGAE